MERTVVIDGFAFHNRKDAMAAQKELEGVNYLNEKMSGLEPAKVLALYNKVVAEDYFETPVGLHFLRSLEADLTELALGKNEPGMESASGAEPPFTVEDILPVEVKLPDASKRTEVPAGKQETAKEAKMRESQKRRLRISIFVNIVLVLMVIAMFVIVRTSDNVNILNYENALIDKYESWESDLAAREAALQEEEKTR